jgi:hypothetical protein
MKPEIPDRFSRKAQIPNFIKICPVGVEFFHADNRTDGHDESTFMFVTPCVIVNKKNLLFYDEGSSRFRKFWERA